MAGEGCFMIHALTESSLNQPSSTSTLFLSDLEIMYRSLLYGVNDLSEKYVRSRHLFI